MIKKKKCDSLPNFVSALVNHLKVLFLKQVKKVD